VTDTRQRCLTDDERLLRDELVETSLATAVAGYYRAAVARMEQVLEGQEATEPLPSPVSGDVQTLCSQLGAKVADLRASGKSSERAALVRERQELQDRQLLAMIYEDLEAEVKRRKKAAALALAIRDTDTNKVTRKSTALADVLITAAWRDGFAKEVNRLGIHHLRIELQRKGSRQGTPQFRIDLIRNSTAKLGSILSEGEYRCVALAAFLSELTLSENPSGIVFDDPVSSLDHDYRDEVAKRLAEEAASGRQVIVFTHDVFFLECLSRQSKAVGQGTIRYHTVSRLPDGSRAGVVENGVPPTVAPADAIADGIANQVTQLEGLYTSGRTVEWGQRTNGLSNQLRKCWERAVAEVVSPVVKRFDTNVDTKNVWQLTALETADFVEMRGAYKRCSALNHERCAELGRSDPPPQNFLDEVEKVKDWLERVRTKQQAAQQNRPQILDSPLTNSTGGQTPKSASDEDEKRCQQCGSNSGLVEVEVNGKREFFCEACKPSGEQ